MATDKKAQREAYLAAGTCPICKHRKLANAKSVCKVCLVSERARSKMRRASVKTPVADAYREVPDVNIWAWVETPLEALLNNLGRAS